MVALRIASGDLDAYGLHRVRSLIAGQRATDQPICRALCNGTSAGHAHRVRVEGKRACALSESRRGATRQSGHVAASRYIGNGWPRQIAHSYIDGAPAMRPFSRKKGAATVWRMTVAASIDAYARIAWAREDWLTGTRSRAKNGSRRTRSSPRSRYLDVYGGGT